MVYLTAIFPCTFWLFPVFSRNSVAIHMSVYAECTGVLGYLFHGEPVCATASWGGTASLSPRRLPSAVVGACKQQHMAVRAERSGQLQLA